MKWKELLLVMSLMAALIFPQGQTLAEVMGDEEEFKDLWSSELNAGFSFTSGNSETTSLGITFKAVRDTKGEKRRVLTFLSNYFYDTAQDVTTTNKGSGTTKYDIYLTQRFSYFGDVLLSFDKFMDIDLRVVPGLGISYILWTGRVYEFTTLAGVNAVLEYFSDGTTDEKAAFRGGNRFKLNLSKNSIIEQQFDIFSDFEEPSDFIIHTEVSLKVAINQSWGIKISVIDDYDNAPLREDIKKNDISLLTSINYSF